jgi:hypothetical protein
VVLPKGSPGRQLAEVARDPPAADTVGVDEAVRAQIDRRLQQIGVVGRQKKSQQFCAIDAERWQSRLQPGPAHRQAEHEKGGEGGRRRELVGERQNGRNALGAVQRGIRLCTPEPGEGFDAEGRCRQVGAETVDEVRLRTRHGIAIFPRCQPERVVGREEWLRWNDRTNAARRS